MIVDELKKSILKNAFEGLFTTKQETDSDINDMLNKNEESKKQLLAQGIVKKSNHKGTITDIFKKPYHWKWVYIDDIAFVTKLAGFEYTKYIADNLCEEGIPLFKGKNVQNGEVILEFESFIPEELSDSLKRSQVNKKCLLTPYVGTIGNVGIFDGSFKAHLGSNVGKIEIFNESCILNEFLLYYLRSPHGYKELSKHKKATAQESISIDAIRDVIVPLPPIEEQERIINKIDYLFDKLDKIKPIEEELSILKANFPSDMKKSVLCEAFNGKLVKNNSDETLLLKVEEIVKNNNKKYKPINNTELPKSWKMFKFGDLFDIINGFTPLRTNNEFWNKKEIPWFTVDDINEQGRIINHTKQFITKLALGTNSRRLLPKNTVLLCCTASVGEYAITNIELTTNQQFNGLVIKKELTNYISPMYVFEFVQTLKNRLISNSGKTTFNFLSTKKLAEFDIPLPPIEEQERIVKKIEQLLPLCNDIENLVKQ